MSGVVDPKEVLQALYREGLARIEHEAVGGGVGAAVGKRWRIWRLRRQLAALRRSGWMVPGEPDSGRPYWGT